MFDTQNLKKLADALEHAARVARAKADQHADAKEHEDAGKQLGREKRNKAWALDLRRAIRALEGPEYSPRKTADTGDDSEGFAMFWAAYPKKAGKGDARRAWVAMRCEPRLQDILAGVGRARESFDWKKDGGQYIPFPATWLRREGWTDQLFKPTEMKPQDPRKETGAEDPPRWMDFLKERKLKPTRFHFAPEHWKNGFADWERANGF